MVFRFKFARNGEINRQQPLVHGDFAGNQGMTLSRAHHVADDLAYRPSGDHRCAGGGGALSRGPVLLPQLEKAKQSMRERRVPRAKASGFGVGAKRAQSTD